VSEVRGLPIEALVQEIKFLREILMTRGDVHAGRIVRFLEPLIQQGLGSEHVRIRAVVLVDAPRVGEVVVASSSLDRIEGFDRAVWVPGTELPLEELHDRVG
jgi:hypothetical protein